MNKDNMKYKQAPFVIAKRNGSLEPYKGEKIARAIEKSFLSTGRSAEAGDIEAIVAAVEELLANLDYS